MKYTNVYNFPKVIQVLYDKEKQNYDRIRENTYAVTELIKPIKMLLYYRKYFDELEVDISELSSRLLGNALHSYINNLLIAEPDNTYFSEFKLVKLFKDKIIKGIIDLYDIGEKTLIDFKLTSVWNIIYGDNKDWDIQVSLYKWLLEENGFEVKKCYIYAFLKDYSKMEKKKYNDYPEHNISVIEIDTLEHDDVEDFISKRLDDIENCRGKEDEILCTPEERWAKPDTWAVVKNGNKTATRVFEKKEDAEKFIEEQGNKFEIVYRKGEDKRCLEYCDVREFCNYYKQLIGAQG